MKATLSIVLVGGLGCLLLAVPSLTAQQPASTDSIGMVRGVVVDAITRAPVEGAMVSPGGQGRGTLSDSLGVFELNGIPTGPQLLIVRQFGFEERALAVAATVERGEAIEVALRPAPLMIEGLTAAVANVATMNRRLRSRRRAVPVAVRAFDEEALVRSGSGDALEFLEWETFVSPAPCTGAVMVSLCVVRRGRVVEPRVYIDEIPAFGLDELETYPTHALYLVEVYSSGLEIRAYTHQFMKRMARRPMALLPVLIW